MITAFFLFFPLSALYSFLKRYVIGYLRFFCTIHALSKEGNNNVPGTTWLTVSSSRIFQISHLYLQLDLAFRLL